MTETPTRRGRPRGVESQHVMVRMPVDLIAQIDAYAASVQAQIGIIDVNISRGMAIRELVKRGLQSVQANPMAQASKPPMPQAPPPQAPLPSSHLATVEEPEPMAPPMARSQAPAAPSPEAAHRNQRGLPREKFLEIVDDRTLCQELPIRDFAQRLYDKGIYRAKGDKPAEVGWLSRQLKKAQAEGML